MSQHQCCIHVGKETNEEVRELTERTLLKLCSCAKDWSKLDGSEKTAALEVIDILSVSENGCLPSNYGFHKSCYQVFTDKTRIAAAQKRLAKRKINESEEEAPKRVCRSATDCSNVIQEQNSYHRVFQPVCIFCRSTRYVTEAATLRRLKEKLVQCRTLDAANTLMQLAKSKEDRDLLLLIEDEDLIAREAMYHGSCYRSYTYAYTKVEKETDYGYEQFAQEIIEERILQGGHILSVNRLRELYMQISNREITNQVMKQKIQRSHPDLMFLRVTNVNWSELVLPRDAKGSLTLYIDQESHWEEPVEEEEYEAYDDSHEDSGVELHEEMIKLEEKRQLFHSASVLKELIRNAPKMQSPWPPTSSDLTMEAVTDIVPEQLFNFLTCLVGCNTELPEDGKLLDVPEEQEKKIFSICQDIIYLATRGLNPMPKHLALGLTVRHLTGSTKLIGILNGLGHCISSTSVADYDSAVALLNERDEDAIPHGIDEQFTTLVFDNNDFGEETLSGKGTTHCTNGIIVQRCQPNAVREPSRPREPIPKTRGRRPEPQEKHFQKMSLVKRQGPSSVFTKTHLDEVAEEALLQNKTIEAGYIISKFPQVATRCLPSWSGFNTSLHTDVPNKSVIGYLPVLAGSPTRLEIVNEVLKKCISVADRLNQEAVVLVLDQAIYSKAQQIRWLDMSLQQRIVIRLGEFHTCMAFLAVIGKRFKDAGLQDILIESNLVAEGSLNGVLSGHHYNRSVRVMKVLYEALARLMVEAYLQSLTQEKTEAFLNKASHVSDAFHNGAFLEALQTTDFQDLLNELNEFTSVRLIESPTFLFWTTLIRMVETLLLFIRATRTGDWNLHLAAVRQMLPWFFAYDRVNYACYLTVYWLEMMNLTETHPTVHEQFLAGNFVVQQQGEHSFSQTAMDQTIEQTLNRDSKTKGGLTGITLNKNAVHCWILSFAERAKIQECCESMSSRKPNTRGRKELDESRIQRDENDVIGVFNTIKAMTNPFTTPDEELVNVASGKVAPSDIRADLEKAERLGESELEKYIEERMQKKTTDMFSPIKAQKLKTFSVIGKVKGKDEVASLKANSQLLTRMLFIAKLKNLDMKEVLSFSLTPVPPSLGNYDGCLARTNKAVLLHHIAGPENLLASTTPGAIWIIDGMAYLHQLTSIPPTFGMLAAVILHGLLACARKHLSRRVDFVTDRYLHLSIKNSERDRRGEGKGLITRITNQEQKTPGNFKRFLSCPENKEALIAFLYRQWQECDTSLYSDVTIYLAHGDECHAFSSDGVKAVDALRTDHEEADTRLMLHTAHALKESEHIVIQTPDTDVFLLAVALNEKLAGNIEVKMGTASSPKVVSISSVCETISQSVQSALIGFHIFTGCDTTSAFKGKGKIKGYKLMLEEQQYQLAFNAIGESWASDSLPQDDLEQFVCELYGQASASTLIEARTKIFSSCFKTDVSLPPTRDEFVQHLKRANYQAAILKRALDHEIKAPTPCEHGWYLEDGQLAICWSTKPQAPDILLKEVFCKCKKTGCSSARCSCKSHGLKCTELCQCNDCCNLEVEGHARVEEAVTIEDDDDHMDD